MQKIGIYSIAGAAIACLITACGGGSDSGDGIENQFRHTLAGGAASYGAISGAKVSVWCASGFTANATTDEKGQWALAEFPASALPCALQLTGGTAAGEPWTQTLQALAIETGWHNLTPISDLALGIAVGNAYTSNWSASASGDALNAAAQNMASGAVMGQLQATLDTLPAKPQLPSGTNVLTAPFEIKAGDAVVDLNRAYIYALVGAQLNPEEAVTLAAQRQALTQEAYAYDTYTTPDLLQFRSGYSVNLDGSRMLSIPDPLRGLTLMEVEDIPESPAYPYRSIESTWSSSFGYAEMDVLGSGYVFSRGRSENREFYWDIFHYFLMNVDLPEETVGPNDLLNQRYLSEFDVIGQRASPESVFFYIDAKGTVHEELRVPVNPQQYTKFGPAIKTQPLGHVNDLLSPKGILSPDGTYKLHAKALRSKSDMYDDLNEVSLLMTRSPVNGDNGVQDGWTNALSGADQDFELVE